jgi:cell surface protein SprA
MKALLIGLLCLIIVSCKEKSTEPGAFKVIQSTYFHAYDYASNFFFLDTAYKSIYKDYFNSSTPVIPSYDKTKFNRIIQFEVWMATNNIKNGEDAHVGVAFADLNPININSGESYSSDMKKADIYIGEVERGFFIKMDSNEYSVDKYLGIIRINILRPDRYYAVSYRIEGETHSKEDDLEFGTLSNHTLETDTLVLKLIYRPNMQPGFKTLWDRQMKNKYGVGETYIDISKIEVKLYYITDNNDTTEYLYPYNDKLVDILNVDRTNNYTGAQPPDGEFDLKAWFFDKDYGTITLPSLEPFSEELIDWALNNNKTEEIHNYLFPEVYDTTRDVAMRSEKDRFLIVYNKLGK